MSVSSRFVSVLALSLGACGEVSSNIDAPSAPPSDAPPIDTPPATKKVFISSLTFFADIGGTAGADSMCQNMAAAAGLVGVYRAWLSTAADPVVNRFTHSSVPYALVNGTVIANSWTDLVDGSPLVHGIDLDEQGRPLPSTGITLCHGTPTCAQTFTGTAPSGAYQGTDNQCLNWTSRVFQNGSLLNTFIGGDSKMNGSEWTVTASGFRCDYQARIYCFQQ